VYLSLCDLDLLDAWVACTLRVLSSRASRLIYKDSYSQVERIDREFTWFYDDSFDWEIWLNLLFRPCHKCVSQNNYLNSFRTQIDNKQEINLKPEDIFIIIEKVYTEGVYKCSLILVVVAYAILLIFWRETLNT
jgi:hypothetical protein